MPLPVKNTCSPASKFGGFDQTLFLGCSVVSFSASAGWNEQKSELTVQLIQDPCPGPKTYYDRSLLQQSYTGPDPGFIGEETDIIGVPAYFRVADFEFSGIIQDWSKADIRTLNSGLPVESLGVNNNIYTVKISDPREILENAQVIVNEYAGFTSGLDNIVNAYGFMEAQSANCPPVTQGVDGTIFGAPAAGFGGADVDDNGMPWNNILAATRVLLGGTSTYGALGGAFSAGYLAFKGVSNNSYTSISGVTSGMGILDQNSASESHYVVDLTDLPTLPAQVRMNGASFSLLDLITQVCDIAGYDYYVELLPVGGGAGTWSSPVIDSQGITKIIKVRTVDRNIQPTFGAIETFINNNEPKTNEMGRELRNELTNQLIVGGPKQNAFDTDNVNFLDPEGDGDPANSEADDMIVPHFGVDIDGNAIIPTKNADGCWEFEADVRALNIQLAEYGHALGVNFVTIDERELLAAQSSKESWMIWSEKINSDIRQAFGDFQGMFGAQMLDKAIAAAGNANQPAPRDAINLGANLFKVRQILAQKRITALQVIFDFVNNIATTYYGTKFQVRVPSVCAYVPSSQDGTFVGWGGEITTSEVPSDGGWSQQSPILGLTNPAATSDFFRLEDGRFGNILRFADLDEQNIADLDREQYIGDTATNTLWHKAQNEQDYVYADKATLFSPRVVLSISAPIDDVDDQGAPQGEIEGLRKLINAAVGPGAEEDAVADLLEEVGAGTLWRAWGYKKKLPTGALVCVKSNALKYGPYGSSTVAGKASVKNEEGLVPWEYGSYANMDLAGNNLAAEGITFMQVGERGSITIPGYPTLSLGAELGSTSGGTNLFGGRSLTVNASSPGQYISTSMTAWTGSNGPNITGITTSVSSSGLETSYTMRTFTPKFGRFARYNAERLKQIGQNGMKAAKALRAFQLQRLKIFRAASTDRFLKNLQKKLALAPDEKVNTPHELIVGAYNSWGSGDYNRPIVSDNPLVDFNAETPNYETKAYMSWDGLLLPVSMDGDGNLPQYATPLTGCVSGHPKASIPPMYKEGEAGGGGQQEYNLAIDVDYLNPFSNPSSLNRSKVTANYSDTPNIGHHVEIVGREGISGNEPPASSIVMPMQGFIDTNDTKQSDYKDDYRMMAERGPKLMHGWGYDTNGFPVPNKADSEVDASGGVFTDEDLQCKFMDDWLRKPHTWPVGPIDLRWDRDRAVWVSPPAYTMVCGRLKEHMTPGGSALVELVTDTSLYDCSGNTFDGEFYVHDCLSGLCPSSGDMIMAEYDTYSCRYVLVNQKVGHTVKVVEIYSCMPYNESGLGRDCVWDSGSERFVGSGDPYSLYPGLLTEHGPFQSGWKGIAVDLNVPVGTEPIGHSGAPGKLTTLITAHKKHEFIEFCTSGEFGAADFAVSGNESITANAVVSYGWDGIGDISESHVVQMPIHRDANCWPSGTCGIAILDEVATSAVNNNTTCDKWVYNIVDLNECLRVVNSGCSGLNEYAPSTPTGTGCAHELVFGTGLRVTENPGEPGECKYVVNTTHCAQDTNQCIDFENEGRLTPVGTHGSPLNANPMECLVFGAGLMAATGINGNGRACDVFVNAGFVTSSGSDCIETGTLRDPTYNRVINRIDWHRGIKAVDGIDGSDTGICSIRVGAGFGVTGTNTCITGFTLGTVSPNKLYAGIKALSGIGIVEDTTDPCAICIGLNLKVEDGDGGEYLPINTLIFNANSGLQVSSPEDCVASIGICMVNQNSDDCLEDEDEDCFGSGVRAMGGIKSNVNGGFLELGLDLEVSDTLNGSVQPVNHIEFSNASGFVVEDQSDCKIRVGWSAELTNNTDCLLVDNDDEWSKGITLKKGLKGAVLGDGYAQIGLDLAVGSVQPVAAITAGNGLNVVDEGSCTARIEVCLGEGLEFDGDGCIRIDSGINCSSGSGSGSGGCPQICAGKGISIDDDDCVELDLTVGTVNPVAAITFSDCFSVTDSGNCTADVALSFAATNDELCLTSWAGGSWNGCEIRGKNGINLNVNGDILEIGLGFEVNDVNPATKIQFSDCFQVDSVGCRADVALNLEIENTPTCPDPGTASDGTWSGCTIRSMGGIILDTDGENLDIGINFGVEDGGGAGVCGDEDVGEGVTPVTGIRFGSGIIPTGIGDCLVGVRLNFPVSRLNGCFANTNASGDIYGLQISSGLATAWAGPGCLRLGPNYTVTDSETDTHKSGVYRTVWGEGLKITSDGQDACAASGSLHFLTSCVTGCITTPSCSEDVPIYGLDFGSGLWVQQSSPQNSDRAKIQVNYQLYNETGNNLIEPTTRLNVGSGLVAHTGRSYGGDSQSCEGYIALDFLSDLTNGCWDNRDGGDKVFGIRWGSGLYPRFSDAGENGADRPLVDVLAGITIQEGETGTVYEPITRIHTTGNIVPLTGSTDCDLYLSGQRVCFTDVTGCWQNDFDADCYEVDKIGIGSGIYATTGTQDQINLMAGIHVDYYDSNDAEQTRNPTTRIVFGDGLIGDTDGLDDCAVRIDWSGEIGVHQDCLASETAINGVEYYSRLLLGTGIKAVDNGNGVFKLDVQLDVDNVRESATTQNFEGKNKFRFMEGLVASGSQSDCTIDIDINLDILSDGSSQVERVLDINFTSGLIAEDGGSGSERQANVGLPILLTAGSVDVSLDGGGSATITWDQYGRITSVA